MLLKDYLPPAIANTRIFSTLLNAEQLEIDTLDNSIQDIVNQCFVNTATWGLDNWESLLGISTDHSKDINYRRTVVTAKLRGSGSVTVNLIQNVAGSFSNGKVAVIEHPSIYSFEVMFVGTIGIPPNLSDLQDVINQIKPAHLAVTYTFLYTQWSKVKTTTWATVKTGTWDGIINGRVI
ncbi:YmfQ family protein [Desulfosporosinus sp. SB140]|uniref:YmfQ family protein n=1 Tax=Desulfosporosinus paludis TaxID=3115649 RepID=UPI00388E995C